MSEHTAASGCEEASELKGRKKGMNKNGLGMMLEEGLKAKATLVPMGRRLMLEKLAITAGTIQYYYP